MAEQNNSPARNQKRFYKKNQLQDVSQFKNFLLENDSQFKEYLNNDLLHEILDCQLMKEQLISFVAKMMGPGVGNQSQKDNFYLQTRSLLQDTLALFYVLKNIQCSNSVEYYLPRLVEMLADLCDVERCSIFLYDKSKDELYCKVITGRLKEAISFQRVPENGEFNILTDCFNSGEFRSLNNIKNTSYSLGNYDQVDTKLHQITRNILLIPIKLGQNAVGCLEIANKKNGNQDITNND